MKHAAARGDDGRGSPMSRLPAWLPAALAALTMGCASAPSLEGRTASSALQDTDASRLGRAFAPQAARNPGKSGFHPLPDGREAFAARVLVADAADRSLDVQYYIWHGDETGYLLFDALWRAAKRGVRVRLLLDDANTAGLDATIAALDAHPNIEVRLYNPLFHRGVRAINFVTDFTRVNRRMHNKSFTADNRVAIVGGRNVGNEYYEAGSGVWFKDLDVIAVGPVVREVSAAFDLYWNSESAYPAARLVGNPGPDGAAALEARFAEVRSDPRSVAYVDALRRTALVHEVQAGTVELEWTTARLLRDDPSKTLDTTGRRDVLLLSAMLAEVGVPKKSFDLVSPYLVPGEDGTAALVKLAGAGVEVRILTNSLAATDVGAVHAGYSKRRPDLLRAGVRLYELKPTAEDNPPREKGGAGASSSGALHAKTFAVDRSRVFVGSFNFDERSAFLNTEMGILIDSPTLAGRLADGFDDVVPKAAYEVRFAPGGEELEWVERTPAGDKVYATEPETGALRRGWVGFLTLLPIDWLL
jgi:putative cardiolipin synthase